MSLKYFEDHGRVHGTVLEDAETVVIGNKDPEFRNIPQQRRSASLISFAFRTRGAFMASTTVSVGEEHTTRAGAEDVRDTIYSSILRLSDWLERNHLRGYDTFDGLEARFLRPLTFESNFLRTVLQQGIRRFPLNLRPLLGVSKAHSTKAMGFFARGFLRMHQATGDQSWKVKAENALRWLIKHQSSDYSGACWGNHFDYQSRSFYLPKGVPTVVWTSLIGHAFLDGYDACGRDEYLQVAISACEHICRDLERFSDGDTLCIGYIPAHVSAPNKMVHNSNTLAASLLSRVFAETGNESFLALAERAMRYTAKYQQVNGSWFYGERFNLHWVDNFHSAYVLDCFKLYRQFTGDHRFDDVMHKGYTYWKQTFFLADGTPRYYDRKTLPIDIQCCSQAIDTLVFFQDLDRDSLALAAKVADWTIDHMQDRTGYFYYRRYSSWLVNRTPTLHWGQATMLCALAGLYKALGPRKQ
jgi:rhamnogalacturonyl hydrolase YesR